MQEPQPAPIARAERPRLIPPRLGARDVARPRLEALLATPRQRPVSVVVAPSGLGKTTLVARWASEHEGPVGWLTLDPVDSSPATLGHALVDAMRRVAPGFGRNTLVLVTGQTEPDPAGIGATIAEEIAALDVPVVLVLDDAHILASGPAWTVIDALIAHAGEGLHFVMTSRTPPQVDLEAMRAARRLVEIDSPALRFTATEAGDLAGALGAVDLPPDVVAAAVERSGGWAPVLRLLLLRRDLSAAAGVQGAMDDLLERLVGLALDAAPAGVQRAAMWGALLPWFDPRLLAAVVPADDRAAAGVRIREIAALGLPMSGPGRMGEPIAFHPVVLGVLRARLAATESPHVIAEAHRRAATWYRDAGHPVAAIRQALAGEDEALAIALVAGAGFAAMRQERWLEIAELIDELPADVPDRSPVIAMLACWAAYRLTNDALGAAIGRFMVAVDSGAAEDERWPTHRLRALVDVLVSFGFASCHSGAEARARVARIAQDLDPSDEVPLGMLIGITGPIIWSLEGADAGLAYLADELSAVPPLRPGVRCVALQGLMLMHGFVGTPASTFAPVLEEAAALARAEGLPLSLATVASSFGWLELRRLDLPAAARWFGATIDDTYLAGANLWRQSRLGDVMLLALQGRPDDALARLDDMRRVIDRLAVDEWIRNAAAFRARIGMLVGRPEIALAWLDETGAGIPEVMPGFNEAADLTRARVLLLRPTADRIAEARNLLESLSAQVDAIGLPKLREPIALCRALIAEINGRRDEALGIIEPTLASLDVRDDLLTLFEFAPALAPLLDACRERGIAIPYLDRVSEARRALLLQRTGVEARELNDVALMSRIAAGQTFDQIAAETGVSANVVRSRARQLFRELRAASRSDAIVQARRRGMLP
jgi:LuxR family maltose regulon positive regulatory protein